MGILCFSICQCCHLLVELKCVLKKSLYPKLRPDLKLPSLNIKYENLFIEILKKKHKYIVGRLITTTETVNLIFSQNGRKSCGADGISPQLLKDNFYLLSQPLKHIYNLSIAEGVVPKPLKIAKVIPIFKKGETSQPSNYRPISLLSIFNKLLEKLIYRRLYNFLTKNSVLYR